MSAQKKTGIGTWITLIAVVLAVIALILYAVALGAGNKLTIASGSDPFYDMARPEDAAMRSVVLPCGIAAILLLVIAVAAAMISPKGTAGKACDIIAGLLRIAAPALLLITALYFLYGSFTGIGWTFFSNAELAIYPEATAVGTNVIAGIVLLVIAAIVAAVAAYTEIQKKNAD